MNILIIGSGGREHAIADTYAKSGRTTNIYVAPGNDLMEEKNSKIHTLSNLNYQNHEKLLAVIRNKKIDLVDVAGDEPLASGLVDFLSSYGIPSFGPTKNAAELEWNKSWSRSFMQKYKLPIPKVDKFSDEKSVLEYLKGKKDALLFVKASGLAGGKGVIRTENSKDVLVAIKKIKGLGISGKEFLIEEGLSGEEFSFFALSDGRDYKILGNAQDHKTVYENGQGPNTGGMGCASPVSILNKTLEAKIKRTIFDPLFFGMTKEKRPYSGILYLGGMLTKKGVKIIEFNARLGDPEAEVILPSLKTDYTKIVEAVHAQKITALSIASDNKTRVSITACARGYPEDYGKVMEKEIFGLEKLLEIPEVLVFGAGIKRQGKKYLVNGGRILHVVGAGKNIFEAREKAYQAMSNLYIQGNNLHYRTDIGYKEIEKNL